LADFGFHDHPPVCQAPIAGSAFSPTAANVYLPQRSKKTDSTRQTASELHTCKSASPIFWEGRAMVTSFLHYFAGFSQGIGANFPQWLERAGNNRKVAGSNLCSITFSFRMGA